MRVIITGGTGVIGHRLSYWMVREGHEVIVLSRNSQAKRMPPNVQGARWDAYSAFGWGHLLDGNTVIVNLAGEHIAALRWTDRHKRRVLSSRIDATEAVGEAVAYAPEKPALLIQASAVGYYGSRGDQELTEADEAGSGFLAEVCQAWEAAAKQIPIRTAILRIGDVLSLEGGYLPAAMTAARLSARRLGSGDQWVPWVHVDDVAHAIGALIRDHSAKGVYNLTAPHPVTNADFMGALSHIMGAPRLIGVPTGVLKLMLGEQASVVLNSLRVLPKRLLAAGFTFRYPTIERALDHLLARRYRRSRD